MQRELHPLITKQCKCCDRRRRFSTFESTCTHSRSCFCVYIIFSKSFADFRFIPLRSGSCHALSFPIPLAPSSPTSSPSACGFLSNKTFNTCFFFFRERRAKNSVANHSRRAITISFRAITAEQLSKEFLQSRPSRRRYRNPAYQVSSQQLPCKGFGFLFALITLIPERSANSPSSEVRRDAPQFCNKMMDQGPYYAMIK